MFCLFANGVKEVLVCVLQCEGVLISLLAVVTLIDSAEFDYCFSCNILAFLIFSTSALIAASLVLLATN